MSYIVYIGFMVLSFCLGYDIGKVAGGREARRMIERFLEGYTDEYGSKARTGGEK